MGLYFMNKMNNKTFLKSLYVRTMPLSIFLLAVCNTVVLASDTPLPESALSSAAAPSQPAAPAKPENLELYNYTPTGPSTGLTFRSPPGRNAGSQSQQEPQPGTKA